MADRQASLEYIKTSGRLGKATIARGDSVSFEWPRHCEGWKEEVVKTMLEELKLKPVEVDGCAVCVRAKSGEPILKPWRIAVSSRLTRQALDGLRCQGGHKHIPCPGNETARSAFYPAQLCNAIHDGLDAHESASAGKCVGDGCVATCPGNQNPLTLGSAAVKVFEPEASNRNPLALSSAAVTVCEPTASNRNRLTLSSAAVTVCGLADAEDPAWELFCLGHNMHELAQDDDKLELAPSHRPLRGVALGLFTTIVTRITPTSSPEAQGEGCLKALLNQTTKLLSRTVWDESLVEEWSAVRKQDPTASCGRVFSILGQKNAERHAPEGEREHKARIVFAGNAIQTASGVAPHELFQEVSSAPAAMASIRAVLAVSALRGWPTKARDAAQAYIQARNDGPGRPRTWVCLLKSWWPQWPPSWFTETASLNIGTLSARFSGHWTGTRNPEPSGRNTWRPSWKSWDGSASLLTPELGCTRRPRLCLLYTWMTC